MGGNDLARVHKGTRNTDVRRARSKRSGSFRVPEVYERSSRSSTGAWGHLPDLSRKPGPRKTTGVLGSYPAPRAWIEEACVSKN